VDGAVTVKKLYRDAGGQIRLQPANPEMLPLIVRGDHVRIRGVVVGVLRKYGFSRQPPRTKAAPPRPAPPRANTPEELTLELSVNVLDAQLARWNTILQAARRQPRFRAQLPAMEDLARDLQSLRDWCARTAKPGLRRALIAEANKIIRKMQKFAVVADAVGQSTH
jgi:hypothetical protein